jgi:putative transposase
MVRDMMLIAVERRFGAYQAPHRVEFLADSGSCQTAYETVDFAIALGLMARFTRIRSPESNGMADSFVKTFKRDNVRCNARPDAKPCFAGQIFGSRIQQLTPASLAQDALAARVHQRQLYSLRVRFNAGNST